MPLTPFQRGVAQILAKNRNPESHVAGGAVINRGEHGVRISDDLDIFHDLAASVAASAEADVKALREAGYAVEWTLRAAAMFSAQLTRGEDHGSGQLRLQPGLPFSCSLKTRKAIVPTGRYPPAMAPTTK